jgi:serine/threonine protein kinase/uncharacterized RDD family membrane protein YckC
MMKRIDAGMRVGEYVVESKVGEGSFGEVWRARHRAFDDMVVALKIPRDVRALARLRDEGCLARRVDADGAVKLLGLDADHDPPYVAFEFVDGETLRDLLARGPIRWERSLAIARRVFAVLHAAHEIKIVHRDVKPENILIDRVGNAFLTDFGLALSVEDARTITLASSFGSGKTQSVVGTLRYMSPEQKDPRRGVDRRSDIYSAGLVLFEMLTGTLPEGGEVPGDLVPGVDPAFDDLFRRCYARLERRYRTAGEVVAALDEIARRHELRRRVEQERRQAQSARPLVDVISPEESSRLRSEFRGAGSPEGSPNLISWDEARALLRVSDQELLRLVDTGTIARVACQGALYFRRQDVIELRGRIRRIATLDRIEIRVAPPTPRIGTPPLSRPAPVLSPLALRPAEPPRPESAGFFVRGAAFGVDATIVAVCSALAGADLFATPALVLAHLLGGPELATAVVRTPVFLDAATVLFVAFIYFTIFTALAGRTIGKWLLGLRVVGTQGEELGVGRSIARSIGYIISATPFGLGLLSIALDSDHRGFHDIVADSRVVYET